jgi:hypothetical protein
MMQNLIQKQYKLRKSADSRFTVKLPSIQVLRFIWYCACSGGQLAALNAFARLYNAVPLWRLPVPQVASRLASLLRRTDKVQNSTEHDIWYSITLTFSESSLASPFNHRFIKHILCKLVRVHNVRWFHFNFGSNLRYFICNSEKKCSNFSLYHDHKQFNFETRKFDNSSIYQGPARNSTTLNLNFKKSINSS